MKVLLRTQSDARLVTLARAGHDRAFEAIVERYRRPLLRACRRILPEARAEDALQQALMAAWTALRRGDEVRELRPWLYRIVRNTALNQLRMGGHDLDELVETLAVAEDPEEEVERRLLVRQTLAAVAALPERQRDALLRTAIEGRGQDEVARDLGLTDTALRQLVHRARVSVRAAATAVVPLPFAAWLAAAPRAEPMAARIVELVAGTGAGATLAKAGTVALLAGGAMSAPALVEEDPANDRPVRERPARKAEATKPPAPAVVTVVARAQPVASARVTPVRDGGDRAGRGDDRARGDDRDKRGDDDRDLGGSGDADDRDHDNRERADDRHRGDRDDDASGGSERDEGDRDDGSSGADEPSRDDDASGGEDDTSGDDKASGGRESSRDADSSTDDESSGDGERGDDSSD